MDPLGFNGLKESAGMVFKALCGGPLNPKPKYYLGPFGPKSSGLSGAAVGVHGAGFSILKPLVDPFKRNLIDPFKGTLKNP